jgi:hypothetical protein
VLRDGDRAVDVSLGHRHPRGDRRVVEGRSSGVQHRGERLELELDRVDRAPRQLGLLGGGHRQAIAHEPHDASEDRLAVPGGEDRGDASEGPCGRGVGTHHPRVGEGRAPQGQVQRPGEREVAGEGGLTGGAAEAHGSFSAAAEAAPSTAATGLA